MDLSKIISIAGKSGLYRVVAQGRQALIAESLEDGKRIPVHASLRVSSLDEISMFTTGDDVPLRDVLAKLHEIEKGGPSADPKSEEEVLWNKLAEALPTHDRGRIYVRDVRKLFLWYGQLLKAGVFAAAEQEEKEKESETAKAAGEKRPAKAAKAADVAVKKANAPKPGGGSTKAKTAGSTMRKGSQRGS
jgi:pyruvate/2-oxoglutarate dehydrogenase complex dihydrolipoamide acyltransferase (E2) component